MIEKLLIRLKWKYSRWLVKYYNIRFRKYIIRSYHIQELSKLPQYDHDALIGYRYNKLRKLFIKEYPNEQLHNPYED